MGWEGLVSSRSGGKAEKSPTFGSAGRMVLHGKDGIGDYFFCKKGRGRVTGVRKIESCFRYTAIIHIHTNT